MAVRGLAPAKVNLTLHVTGQRADGYHLLDSLVVFAGVADTLSATPAPNLHLTVTGPFSAGVPTDESNLVLRAARVLQKVRGVAAGAHIVLEKALPHAAGLGSGSADAAAAIDLLARLWQVPPLAHDAPEVLALGADVPACCAGPGPLRMSGIGEVVAALPTLPECALVLVNPRVAVPTADVFRGLSSRNNLAMPPVPAALDFDGFAAWLSAQRNDLLPNAEIIAPQISTALERLSRSQPVKALGMSGSGATCYGLVRNMADARQVARAIQVAEMGWWVVPAEVLQTTRATT